MVYDAPVVDTKGNQKSEAEQVGLWQQRISISKKCHDDWVTSSGAKRFCEEYKGDFSNAGVNFYRRGTKVPVPPINEVFAYVQTDIAQTYNRDPYLTVNPKAGTVKGAKLWEVWLNYEWRELKTKEELELEIIDKDLVGYAFHKVGHTVNSEGSGEELKILSESIYSTRVDWRDMFWNLGARRPPKDCHWMAQRIFRPLDDIKAKYPNAKNLKGSQHPDLDEDSYKKASYKDDIEVGCYYEVWDARSRQIYLVAEGLKDVFLDEPRPWPDYLDEFPFVMYWDFAIPGSPRPMSAIAPWEAQILEEMVLLAQAINHAKRWNRQLFIKGGTVDENALDKFERGDDGAIITVNGNLDEASFKFADFGQLPTDFYLLMDRLQAIKRNVHGQPEFVGGGVTKTNTRTIGELQLMSQGSKGRTDRRVDRLETHLENIARHMMVQMKANFDFEKVVQITGETQEDVIAALGENYDPVTRSAKFTAEEISGEYDVEVKAGSTLPMDKENRVRLLETVLPVVAQASGKGPLPPLLFTLIKEIVDNLEIKSLQEAYELEQEQARKAAEEQAGKEGVDEVKTAAEAKKRMAQANQITVDTQISQQEAQIGPLGRAMMKKVEKPEPQTAVVA